MADTHISDSPEQAQASPVDDAASANSADLDGNTALDRKAAPENATASCPVPVLGGLAGGECPVAHDTASEQESAARVFSTSVVISGIRCVLAYVVFPWILPLFGLTDWLGPWIGITISVVAIGFNVASIRRFWRADHPWKWAISAINVSVIGLLSILLVIDLGAVFGG